MQVESKKALLTLVGRKRVAREDVEERYLYCSVALAVRHQQLEDRRRTTSPGEHAHDGAKAALVLFLSTLNERQRRLYAGLESLRLGHGGDRGIAEMTGFDVHTVARGRRELLQQDVEVEGIRGVGGGRIRVEKHARGNHRHPCVARARHGGRSDHGDQVDPQDHSQDQPGARPGRYNGVAHNRRAPAQRAKVPIAGQS